MFLRSGLMTVAFFLLLSPQARAQAPVDIPIPNLRQETPVWCWAAVAQQIIHFNRGPMATPPQCGMVAMANGAHPDICCVHRHPACVRTGSLPQISALIAHFGGRFASYSPPAHPLALYQTLASGRPVIVHIRTGISASHVVVVRGMSFVQTPMGPQPVLHINDPMSHFTQPVPFAQIAPIWIDALVVN